MFSKFSKSFKFFSKCSKSFKFFSKYSKNFKKFKNKSYEIIKSKLLGVEILHKLRLLGQLWLKGTILINFHFIPFFPENKYISFFLKYDPKNV